jgi:hypothetical protein
VKPFSATMFFVMFLLFCAHANLSSQLMIPRSVFGNGGEASANSSYKVKATLGQSLVGKTSDASNQKHIGFWYTLASIKVDAGNINALPSRFVVLGNYPNPFNERTTIRFILPERSGVRLDVFDLLGRKVATIVNGAMDAGEHAMILDGTALNAAASGSRMYFCTLTALGISITHAMIATEY